MEKVRVESEVLSAYKNGVQFFCQTTPPHSSAATAHIHEAIEILYIKEGSYTVFTDEDEYKIFAGDVILFRSNVMHNIFTNSHAANSYYVLKIRPDLIRDLAPADAGGMYLLNFAFKRSNAKCVWTGDETKCIKEISESFSSLENEFKSDRKYSDIAIKLAAGNILLSLLRSGADDGEQNAAATTDRTADCIYKAMTYINQNYKVDITGEEICASVGMSYSYFSRTFKLITGKSFKQYLNLTRINHAERLLATTDKTVSEICFECGYNDVSYFIKVYKQFKQTAPGSFRLKKKF